MKKRALYLADGGERLVLETEQRFVPPPHIDGYVPLVGTIRFAYVGPEHSYGQEPY